MPPRTSSPDPPNAARLTPEIAERWQSNIRTRPDRIWPASIIAYRIALPPPDPLGFVRSLRDSIARLDSISHPGRKGRVPGTLGWVIPRMPCIVVFTREVGAVKVFRILHGEQQWP